MDSNVGGISSIRDAGQERPWRWLWVFLTIAVIVLVTLQVYRMKEHGKVAVQIDALRQAGHPVTVWQLQDKLEAIPDDDNAALLVQQAADALDFPNDAFSRDRWPRGSAPMAPEAKEFFVELLTNNAPALELLHAVARLPKARFPVSYSRGPEALLPHLAKIKSMAQLLRAEATVLSDDGATEAAVTSVVNGVALARTLDTEPLLISQLVRQACLMFSCASLERLLSQHALTSTQVDQLWTTFHGVRVASSAAWEKSLTGELCIGAFCFQARTGEFSKIYTSQDDSSSLATVFLPIYSWSGLKDRDFAFYLRAMSDYLSAARLEYPERLVRARAAAKETDELVRADSLAILSRMLLPSLDRTADKMADGEAHLRCAEAALALEKQRLAQKDAHETNWSALWQTIPADSQLRDPIDGAPLRFRQLKSGYLIYSIGADGVDHGGAERQYDTGSGRKKGTASQNRNTGSDITFAVDRQD